MTEPWTLSAARSNLPEVVDKALDGKPQRITRNGEPAVVVLAEDDYRRLLTSGDGLVAFFRGSPLAEAAASGELDLERDDAPIRDVDL